MAEAFEQELREQLATARRALSDARAASDDEGVVAYEGRVCGLLAIAALHGIDVAD
ncbi:hypothetical protein [Streptomyces sp. FH025]|uniref:hypothetical protein n=1 Tax=Streptomyces sp. FH025 TaxID=2815937 RepID=UPI001A9EA6F1|nr:hypothetical protein [Streptomyces sp. FH025]MBO1419781.1 hypothetical protein [Streptomyces sp. FH025]